MPRPWIVQPHDAFVKHEPDLWSVKGEMKGAMGIRRRMFIARFADGRLAFFNAVPVRDDALRELESWGTPAFLVIPAAYHTLDVAPFKARHPQLRVIANPGVRERAGKQVRIDGGTEHLPQDPRIQVHALRGTRGEIAVSAGGTLAFPGDAMMNLPRLKGLGGMIFNLIGSTGGPKVTRIAKLFAVSDKEALRDHFLELADLPGLARVVPCHGQVVEQNPREVLRDVAAGLISR